ncbi:MAG: outer membrane beta-barrel protein [Bacteroidales bacterium]|nr:outer membrane beta-barrel protein [Bacteroidales bacterium]
MSESLHKHHLNCRFKESPDSKVKVYSPNDIAGYRFLEGRYYVTKKINDTYFFLEFLLDGVKDLYYLKKGEDDTYFIQNTNNQLIELKNTERTIIQDQESLGVREQKEYLGILKYTFNDSPKIVGQIENTGYNHSSLIKITENYHNSVCTDYSCINYSRNTILTYQVGFNIGYNFQKVALTFEAPTFNWDTYTSEANSQSLTYSINLEIGNIFGVHERFRYLPELHVLNTNSSFKYFDYQETDLYLVPVNFRYYVLDRKIQPFVSAGVGLYYPLKKELSNLSLSGISEDAVGNQNMKYSLQGSTGLRIAIGTNLDFEISYGYIELGKDRSDKSFGIKRQSHSILCGLSYKLKK